MGCNSSKIKDIEKRIGRIELIIMDKYESSCGEVKEYIPPLFNDKNPRWNGSY